MNTLEQLALAIKLNDKLKINEASLNRVYQHTIGDASNSFAIITAYRGEYSKNENQQRNSKLKSDIRSLKLGFFKLKGHWLECKDDSIDYSECPDNMKVPTVEESLFIPNISKKDAIKLANKYKQDGIIYQGEESNNIVQVISKSGQTLDSLGKFSPNKISQGYSKIKGRTFTFEGFEYRPSGMMTNIIFNSYLKK